MQATGIRFQEGVGVRYVPANIDTGRNGNLVAVPEDNLKPDA